MACSKKDTGAPIIKSVLFDGQKERQVFYLSDSIEIRVDFSDDRALEKGFISISPDFEGSGSEVWRVTLSGKLSGESDQMVKKLKIPNTVSPGNYTITLRATDNAGNSSSKKVTMVLSNAKLPKINLISPAGAYYGGDELTFEGTITDDQNLSFISLKVYAPDYTAQPTLVDTSFVLPGTNDTLFDFGENGDFTFLIPMGAVRFDYDVVVVARDEKGNSTVSVTGIAVWF